MVLSMTRLKGGLLTDCGRGQPKTPAGAFEGSSEKEKSLGKSLPKDVHVDHKNNNKHDNSAANLQTMSAKKNIGKGNKNR